MVLFFTPDITTFDRVFNREICDSGRLSAQLFECVQTLAISLSLVSTSRIGPGLLQARDADRPITHAMTLWDVPDDAEPVSWCVAARNRRFCRR